MSAERKLLFDEPVIRELAIRLHEEGLFGVKEDPNDFIRLKGERMSPHYFDIRPGISNYQTRKFMGRRMLDLANLRAQQTVGVDAVERYDHFAGTPEAMTSYATTIADLAEASLLQPRVDTKKQRGNKTPIFGRFEEGDSVAQFDDVVTDGKSKRDTIELMGRFGLEVLDYFIPVDREEGGAVQVHETTGLWVTPAIGASTLVRVLYEDETLNQVQYDNVRSYFDQYGEPHAQEILSSS